MLLFLMLWLFIWFFNEDIGELHGALHFIEECMGDDQSVQPVYQDHLVSSAVLAAVITAALILLIKAGTAGKGEKGED
jgi:hypothetical protein